MALQKQPSGEPSLVSSGAQFVGAKLANVNPIQKSLTHRAHAAHRLAFL